MVAAEAIVVLLTEQGKSLCAVKKCRQSPRSFQNCDQSVAIIGRSQKLLGRSSGHCEMQAEESSGTAGIQCFESKRQVH
jgi:hypothetical protein